MYTIICCYQNFNTVRLSGAFLMVYRLSEGTRINFAWNSIALDDSVWMKLTLVLRFHDTILLFYNTSKLQILTVLDFFFMILDFTIQSWLSIGNVSLSILQDFEYKQILTWNENFEVLTWTCFSLKYVVPEYQLHDRGLDEWWGTANQSIKIHLVSKNLLNPWNLFASIKNAGSLL